MSTRINHLVSKNQINIQFIYTPACNFPKCDLEGDALKAHLQPLQRLQNKSVKTVNNLPYFIPTSDLYKDWKIMKLGTTYTYVYAQCMLMYKVENRLVKTNLIPVPNNEIQDHDTRGCRNLHIHYTITNQTKADTL